MQVRDSKVKFLKDEELGTVVHVHKPQKAQQQQQQQVAVQGCCFAGGACQGQLTAALLASLACSITFSKSALGLPASLWLGLGSAMAHWSQCKLSAAGSCRACLPSPSHNAQHVSGARAARDAASPLLGPGREASEAV